MDDERRELKALIQHWRTDKACNLTPTDEMLLLAETLIASIPDADKQTAALREIAERHIPDQPASSPFDEPTYLRRQYAELRRIANAALSRTEGAQS
jgi:hypothetical protein